MTFNKNQNLPVPFNTPYSNKIDFQRLKSNQVVRKVTYSDGIITIIAGTGHTASGVLHDGSKSTVGEYNGDNIPATSASLNILFSTH